MVSMTMTDICILYILLSPTLCLSVMGYCVTLNQTQTDMQDIYIHIHLCTDPDGIGNAFGQSSLGVPAEDLVLVAVIHHPFTQTGASQCVKAAGSAHPQHTVELQQKTGSGSLSEHK